MIYLIELNQTGAKFQLFKDVWFTPPRGIKVLTYKGLLYFYVHKLLPFFYCCYIHIYIHLTIHFSIFDVGSIFEITVPLI